MQPTKSKSQFVTAIAHGQHFGSLTFQVFLLALFSKPGGGWGWGGVVRGGRGGSKGRGGWGDKRRRGLVVTMYRPISANFICRSLACLFTNWDLLSRKGCCCCNGVDCCCNVGNSLLYSVSKKSILSTHSAINVH